MNTRTRRASLFARGVLFDPGSGRTSEVDTDKIDCSTPAGRDQKRAVERLLFRTDSVPPVSSQTSH